MNRRLIIIIKSGEVIDYKLIRAARPEFTHDMKIDKITMIDSKSERVRVRLTARIDENGDLILDGYDSGEFVEEVLHHDDYEYSLTVKAEYKDTILLNLIKEKFKHDAEFRSWLDEKGIPSDFWSF